MQGVVQRRTADRRGAAAKRSDAVLHHRGVSAKHQDVVETDAEFVGGDLRESSFFALAVRTRTRHDCDFSTRLNLHRSAFPSAGRRCGGRTNRADFSVRGNADAHVFTLLACVGLLLAEFVVANEVEGFLQRRGVIARVIHQAGGRGVRELVLRNEIL